MNNTALGEYMKTKVRDLDRHVEGVKVDPPEYVKEAWAAMIATLLGGSPTGRMSGVEDIERMMMEQKVLGSLLHQTYKAGVVDERNNAMPAAHRG